MVLTARRAEWVADAREVPLVFRAAAVAEVRRIVRFTDGDSRRCEIVLAESAGVRDRLHATADAAEVRRLVAAARGEVDA